MRHGDKYLFGVRHEGTLFEFKPKKILISKLTDKPFQELATLEGIRTQCNSEGKVAKYSRFFRPLVRTVFTREIYSTKKF
jgi:hypothetical protein